MSGRDLGSLFDEEGQGATPAPSEAPRPAPVEDSLINDEARQMLEERSRAAREATARAAEVAAQKGKELGKAALGALGRMKEEHQRWAQAKAEAKAAGREVAEPEAGRDATIAAPMSISVVLATAEPEAQEELLEVHQKSVEAFADPEPVVVPAPIVEEVIERPADRSAPAQIEAPAKKRSNKYVWIVGGVLALAAAGGAAYWWSTQPEAAPVAPPEVAAPVVKSVEPTPAPVVEAPPVAPAPVEEVAPTPAPVEELPPAPVVEQKSEPAVAPTPKAEPAPVVPTPKPVAKPRPKRVESAPAPAPSAPPNEEKQIEQIRDFGKQLDSLSGSGR